MRADLPAVNAIQNHFVRTAETLYQDEPFTLNWRLAWFKGRGPRHPVLVAVDEAVYEAVQAPQAGVGQVSARPRVVAWGSLSAFGGVCGYRHTAEVSLYVHPEERGRGVGSLLFAELIRRAEAMDYHTLISRVDAEHTASLAINRKFGFAEAGRLKEAGRKFGRWRTVLYLQRMLRDENHQPTDEARD